MEPEEMTELKKHVTEHITYPATKNDITMTCNRIEHASEDEKKYVEDNLPEGTYESADQVMDAMGMKME